MERTPKSIPARNVDEYLHDLPAPMHAVLQKVREAIKAAAPKAEEVISYRIPTYKYLGPLVHFAAFKDHCSLVVVDSLLMDTFEKELQPFKTSGTTIHFTPAKPLPSTLIRKIVRARIKQNEENAAGRILMNGKKK
jgi:uncharacterized protein YdhG (YjbR/CyaY superfamily)